MRQKTMRRQLAALGCPTAEPTAEMRETVRIMAFNGATVERVALVLDMTEIEVAYWFAKEMDLSEDYYVTLATKAMFELAAQRLDLGVAYKANELMLKTRSSRWREPKAVEAEAAKPVEQMSLIEVDRAIAELERKRRDPAATADAEAPAHDEQGLAG